MEHLISTGCHTAIETLNLLWEKFGPNVSWPPKPLDYFLRDYANITHKIGQNSAKISKILRKNIIFPKK